MQVIKRDGRLTEFNPERIVKAITLAMAQTPGGVDIDLANKIAESVKKQLEDKNQTTVYEIQDLVEIAKTNNIDLESFKLDILNKDDREKLLNYNID